MNIHCLTIPNHEIDARKNFSGADWWFDENGDLQVRVAKMSTWDREMALSIHEIVEAILWFKTHGNDVSPVDQFDARVEEQEPEKHGIDAGDQKDCPYSREHMAATSCERTAALILDVGAWKDYDEELSRL